MQGRIYKITSKNSNKVYIGSTTQTLQRRLYGHKYDYIGYLNGKYNYVTSFEILELGDYRIELIEEIDFTDKKDLLKREGYFIQTTKNTVNRGIVRGLCKDDMHRERSITYYHRHVNDINSKRKVKQECYYCNTLQRKSDTARHNNSQRHIEAVKYYIWN